MTGRGKAPMFIPVCVFSFLFLFFCFPVPAGLKTAQRRYQMGCLAFPCFSFLWFSMGAEASCWLAGWLALLCPTALRCIQCPKAGGSLCGQSALGHRADTGPLCRSRRYVLICSRDPRCLVFGVWCLVFDQKKKGGDGDGAATWRAGGPAAAVRQQCDSSATNKEQAGNRQ